MGRLRAARFGALTRSHLAVARAGFKTRAEADGGEGGIRTRQDLVDSARYRFNAATVAVNASVAVAPCTRLHARPRFRSVRGLISVHVTVDDLAAKQRELTLHVLQLRRRYGVEIAIPHGDVRVLADFDRADAVVEKQLVRSPDRV